MRDSELHLRITVQDPPPGVAWALQVGRDELVRPTARQSGLEFEAVVRIVTAKDGALDLRGPAVQGPRTSRFIYLNSGTRAGQAGSCWDRRAKVSLEGLRTLLSPGVADDSELLAEAGISGTGRDGGPACASVPLLGEGWHLRARRIDERARMR